MERETTLFWRPTHFTKVIERSIFRITILELLVRWTWWMVEAKMAYIWLLNLRNNFWRGCRNSICCMGKTRFDVALPSPTPIIILEFRTCKEQSDIENGMWKWFCFVKLLIISYYVSAQAKNRYYVEAVRVQQQDHHHAGQKQIWYLEVWLKMENLNEMHWSWSSGKKINDGLNRYQESNGQKS